MCLTCYWLVKVIISFRIEQLSAVVPSSFPLRWMKRISVMLIELALGIFSSRSMMSDGLSFLLSLSVCWFHRSKKDKRKKNDSFSRLTMLEERRWTSHSLYLHHFSIKANAKRARLSVCVCVRLARFSLMTACWHRMNYKRWEDQMHAWLLIVLTSIRPTDDERKGERDQNIDQ